MKAVYLAALLLGVATSLCELGAQDKPRPNILLIIADDQNDYTFKASGVPALTPSLDKLKQEAITFTHAYCASPVCGPSRAALFSGLYPHHTGAYLNGSDPWRKSKQLMAAETLPELFRRGNYETWGMGKLYHAKLPTDRKQQWDNDARVEAWSKAKFLEYGYQKGNSRLWKPYGKVTQPTP